VEAEPEIYTNAADALLSLERLSTGQRIDVAAVIVQDRMPILLSIRDEDRTPWHGQALSFLLDVGQAERGLALLKTFGAKTGFKRYLCTIIPEFLELAPEDEAFVNGGVIDLGFLAIRPTRHFVPRGPVAGT
jgi:hypothetical protein